MGGAASDGAAGPAWVLDIYLSSDDNRVDTEFPARQAAQPQSADATLLFYFSPTTAGNLRRLSLNGLLTASRVRSLRHGAYQASVGRHGDMLHCALNAALGDATPTAVPSQHDDSYEYTPTVQMQKKAPTGKGGCG